MDIERWLTIGGIFLGVIFGEGVLFFLLNVLNKTMEEIPSLLGSGLGLIIVILLAAVLIVKIRLVTGLITGVIIGLVLDLIAVQIYGVPITTCVLEMLWT
ncbi:MAG: hypothetical protein ACXQS6_02305 [Candidatus Syntropharchaeales archaeon]|nr:hypothetical protein [Candidatus Syntrophoarchaeum sp.]